MCYRSLPLQGKLHSRFGQWVCAIPLPPRVWQAGLTTRPGSGGRADVIGELMTAGGQGQARGKGVDEVEMPQRGLQKLQSVPRVGDTLTWVPMMSHPSRVRSERKLGPRNPHAR